MGRSATGGRRPVVAVMTAFDTYQIGLVRGVVGVLSPRRIPLIVLTLDPQVDHLPSSLCCLLRHGAPQGVLATDYTRPEHGEELRGLLTELDLPAVHIAANDPGATCVRADNVDAMTMVMRHLLDECGVRRPAMIRGLAHVVDHAERERVLRSELAARGLPVDEGLFVDGQARHDIAAKAIRDLLRRRTDLDAVVATDDSAAIVAMEAVTERGLRVPEDVVVTGFDNYPTGALTWPGVTTVDQNLEEQGRTAARLLLARIAGEAADEHVLVPCTLVVRGSTRPVDPDRTGRAMAARAMAAAARTRAVHQDVQLSMSRALLACRGLSEIGDVLLSFGTRLGLRRCFLAASTEPSAHAATTPDCAVGGEGAGPHPLSRLVTVLRDDALLPVPEATFSSHELLPEHLHEELDGDLLVCQPLSLVDRNLGHLLLEQAMDAVPIAEGLRTDLSRVLSYFLGRQELQAHAETLERLVAERQARLRSEVETRQRTEEELQRANDALEQLVLADGLTQIANRVAFQRMMGRHWRAMRREGTELALAMIDVDHFKAFNDRYGHLTGDDALKTVARCLAEAARRPHDLACRYGGEEFVLLLPGSGTEAATIVVERFRTALGKAAIPHDASPTAPVVTVSVGIAVTRGRETDQPEDLLKAADEALYRAKSAGRDRVVQVTVPPLAAAGSDPAAAGSDPAASVPAPRPWSRRSGSSPTSAASRSAPG